jgi:hypothetical protein
MSEVTKSLVGPALFTAALCLAVVCGFFSDECGLTSYYSCRGCGAAYKQKWFQVGLPGQFKWECGSCGNRLVECSKEESGWMEGREPNVYGR